MRRDRDIGAGLRIPDALLYAARVIQEVNATQCGGLFGGQAIKVIAIQAENAKRIDAIAGDISGL